MDYAALRYFADTWVLVFMCVMFVLMLFFIFRRGTTKKYRQASLMPLEDRPLSEAATADQSATTEPKDARS